MYVISIFMMEWDRNHACLAFTAFTLLFMSYVVSMYQWMFRSYPSPFSCIFTHHTTQIHIISNIIYSLPSCPFHLHCFLFLFISCFNSLSCLVLAVFIVVAVCVRVCVVFTLFSLLHCYAPACFVFSPVAMWMCLVCDERRNSGWWTHSFSFMLDAEAELFSSFLSSSIIQLLCPIGAAVVCVCVCGVFLFLCLSVSLLLISLLLARFSSPSGGDHIPCMSTVIACLACNHGGRAL